MFSQNLQEMSFFPSPINKINTPVMQKHSINKQFSNSSESAFTKFNLINQMSSSFLKSINQIVSPHQVLQNNLYYNQNKNLLQQAFMNGFSPIHFTPTQVLKQLPQSPEFMRSTSNKYNFNYSALQNSNQENHTTQFNFDIMMPQQSIIDKSPLMHDNQQDKLLSFDNNDFESTEYGSSSDILNNKNSIGMLSQQNSEKKCQQVNKKKVVLGHGIVIEKFLDFDNLNDQVDFILSKHKVPKENVKSIIRYNQSGKPKEKRNRLRKNQTQNKILLEYYKKNVNWSKQMIEKVAKELRLKQSQIYKWNWDMRKKDGLIIPNEENEFMHYKQLQMNDY